MQGFNEIIVKIYIFCSLFMYFLKRTQYSVHEITGPEVHRMKFQLQGGFAYVLVTGIAVAMPIDDNTADGNSDK